jgi:hypothetical protein
MMEGRAALRPRLSSDVCAMWGPVCVCVCGGCRYEGEYKDDRPEGEGVLTRADGSCVTGVWRVGQWGCGGVVLLIRG